MNHPEGQSSLYHDYEETNTSIRVQQIVSTIAILVLGYYALSYTDAWPSTVKRTAYELTIQAIPSRLIYFLQHVMMHFGRLSERDCTFGHANFGDFRAKEEALQRMVGNSPIPNVLQKARTFSGYDKLLPVSKDVGPPGLGNWDNSCYQNSVLQGLASLPSFQHYIHRSLLLCNKNAVAADTTDALAVFLNQLADASGPKQTLWAPKVLKSMDSWQQQDAQEYLTRILEAVEKEATEYVKLISRSTNLGLGCLRSKESTSGSDKEKAVRKLLQALIGNPMDGMFAQALTCQTCGFSEGVSLTQFNCLTVNLGLGGQRSLEELLDEYTEPELIEGVECDNCTRIVKKQAAPQQDDHSSDEENGSTKKKETKKELRVKAKQITFGRLPKDLVIHVNRSIFDNYGNQVKNPAFVQFPPRLEFPGRWCAPLDTGRNSLQSVYELKCIVTHSGRHDNGHYVAYGKRDKDWYSFNDEIVTKVSEQQVLTRGNVFMLFYEALDPTELVAYDEDEFAEAEAEANIVEITPSPTSSSAESDIFEEPLIAHSQAPLPAMRTASDGVKTMGSDSPVGRSFVPAV